MCLCNALCYPCWQALCNNSVVLNQKLFKTPKIWVLMSRGTNITKFNIYNLWYGMWFTDAFVLMFILLKLDSDEFLMLFIHEINSLGV